MLEGYYLTVDECLLRNWRKANEGDLTFLRRDKNVGNEIDDRRAFEALQDDYIQQIGIGEKMEEYINLLYQRAKYCYQYYKSKRKQKIDSETEITIHDRKFLNKIQYIEEQIRKINLDNKSGLTISQVLIRISRAHGGALIRESEITVLEYNDLLKEYSGKNGKAN